VEVGVTRVCIVGANGCTFMCMCVFLCRLFQIFDPLGKMLMLCEYMLLVAMALCCRFGGLSEKIKNIL
jgi:hypothetical protein